MNDKTRKASTVLLDFIFGEPIAQPEVIEQDTEQAWQAWLEAMASKAQARSDDKFEATVPMALLH